MLLILVPPSTSAYQFAYYHTHQSTYEAAQILALVWSVVSAPFIVALGQLLRAKSPTLKQSAVGLALFGVLFYGFATYLTYGVLYGINNEMALAPTPQQSTYLAAIVYDVSFLVSDPPLFAIGLAQVMFGWLAWRSGVFADWLAVLGIIGGLCGLGTLFVYQTAYLGVIQQFALAVWALATGAILLRRRG